MTQSTSTTLTAADYSALASVKLNCDNCSSPINPVEADERALCDNCRAIQSMNRRSFTSGTPFSDGIYTSNRHKEAKADCKLTAGEAAKILSKKIGTKISAKELVAGYRLLNGCEPEWHHSGFYRPQGGGRKTMGRTFFFEVEQLDELASRWSEVPVKEAEVVAEAKQKEETQILGFYYEWTHDYSGNYGKKVNFKKMHAYEGSEANKPRNFTACDRETFEMAKAQEGRSYRGWDEPSISNIRERAAR